ncbi:NUDIX domain protein [compost metagenome]
MQQERVASGTVPYRFGTDKKCQVLVVKSTNGKSWVFPKGGVEAHLSRRENALKESYEEAGVIGCPGKKVGRYSYLKGGVMQDVHMYEMLVVEELEVYPESEKRERRWVDLDEVPDLLGPDHQFLLVSLMERFS